MQNETQKTPKNPARAFADLLDELREGEAQIDASEALRKMIKEVRDTCRGGEIHLKLSFKPAGAGKILTITDEIVIKHPKKDKEATLMFSTETGELVKDNPQQQQLPLKDVPKPENVRELPKENSGELKTAQN
jgi:hypothetical protein